MRAAHRAAVSVITSLSALFFVLAGAWLLYPALHARYLVHELNTLQLNRSTFGDAKHLAEKIGAVPTGPCDRANCEWEKRIDNASLPRWWRGSGVGFVVSFNVKQSVVTRKNTGFGVGPVGSFYPSQVGLEEQEDWGSGNTRIPVQAGWYSTDLYRYYSF